MLFRASPRYGDLREQMVENQIRRRGITDERVLKSMRTVRRHVFVPPAHSDAAYADGALPIGHGATISQPYIVAIMTATLEIDRDGLRALEVGTGSGYQAAVLAACGCDVYTVERIPELHSRAEEILRRAGYGDRVHLRRGDGSRGWPEEAPFDRIMITAAAPEVPPALTDQLAEGGLLVAPIGNDWLQMIRQYRRKEARLEGRDIEGARFVPLIEDPEG
jgi:protein-L-isoaspartate(D-aspartate) O-methyltransferase